MALRAKATPASSSSSPTRREPGAVRRRRAGECDYERRDPVLQPRHRPVRDRGGDSHLRGTQADRTEGAVHDGALNISSGREARCRRPISPRSACAGTFCGTRTSGSCSSTRTPTVRTTTARWRGRQFSILPESEPGCLHGFTLSPEPVVGGPAATPRHTPASRGATSSGMCARCISPSANGSTTRWDPAAVGSYKEEVKPARTCGRGVPHAGSERSIRTGREPT